MIKPTRFLFPFMHSMNAEAVEQAVQLASSRHATLVPVSLVYLSEKAKAKGPRLEFVEQANDFLETVRCRAARCHVPVEPVEVITSDVAQAINGLARELDCDAILLFARNNEQMMLDVRVAQIVMQQATRRVYLMRLKAHEFVTLQVC